jgi:cysteine desulfurase
VVRVTGNFQSESPLNAEARQALLAAIDAGWADPRKLSQESSRAALLKNQSIETLAHFLGVKVPQIEIIGEPCLGHFLSLGGLLTHDATLLYGCVDRSEVIATARSHNGPVLELAVTRDGQLIPPAKQSTKTVLSYQLANLETGVIQQEEINADFVAVDATATGSRVSLPERWSTALFDAKSWQGPAGIGVLAISDEKRWRNPLPHISNIRTPYSHSLPLLICAAVALEKFEKDESNIRTLNALLRSLLVGAQIAGNLDSSLSHLLSASFEFCDGEELIRLLGVKGFSADSGSACTAMDLQPSHVLAAMGVLTHGNIRSTIHPNTTEDDVRAYAAAINSSVTELRARSNGQG